MPGCCEPRLFRFIPLLPSGTKLVMSIIGLKSTACRAVKNYTSLFLHVPRTLFETWLQFHVKVVKLPFVVVSAIWQFTPWGKTSDTKQDVSTLPAANGSVQSNGIIHVMEEHGNSEPNKPSVSAEIYPEPRSEDIVRNVKRLRNCAAISITHFTGDDIFWDVPILSAKSKRLADAVAKGDKREEELATIALREHPDISPKPKTKAEFNRLLEEAKGIYKHSSAETVPKTICENVDPVDNGTQCGSSSDHTTEKKCNDSGKSGGKVSFRLNNGQCLNQEQGVVMDPQSNQRLLAENSFLKNRLLLTNKKLDEVLKSSNIILKEVTRLNEQFSRLNAVSSKVTLLQYELEKGKHILGLVEEERNEMRQKLLALSKLIKEEEEYLDDISCESGYEEVGNVCDSPDELGDL